MEDDHESIYGKAYIYRCSKYWSKIHELEEKKSRLIDELDLPTLEKEAQERFKYEKKMVKEARKKAKKEKKVRKE